MKLQGKLFCILFLSVLILAACAAPAGPLVPFTLIREEVDNDDDYNNQFENLIELDPAELIIQGESGNCIVNTNGGGYNSSGGTVKSPRLHGPLVWSTIASALKTKLKDGKSIATKMMASDAPGIIFPDEGPTVILVIDQFTNGNASKRAAGGALWRLEDGEPHYILVAAVDIQDFDVPIATEAIAEAILKFSLESEVLLSDESGAVTVTVPSAYNFVLNMSWLVTPCVGENEFPTTLAGYVDSICHVPENLEEQHSTLLLDALAELDSVNKLVSLVAADVGDLCNKSKEELQEDLADIRTDVADEFLITPEVSRLWFLTLLNNPELLAQLRNPEDPMYKFFNCLVNADTEDEGCAAFRQQIAVAAEEQGIEDHHQFISIAAAGNFGQTYPFAPALWDSVVSVSAYDALTDVFDGSPNRYKSNSGEIAMPGMFAQPVTDIQGTSFAAPRLSVLAALYLLHPAAGICDSSIPTLGYADREKEFNLGIVQNLLWQDAASTYCPDFQDNLLFVTENYSGTLDFQPSLAAP